jgi:hypothetical protein
VTLRLRLRAEALAEREQERAEREEDEAGERVHEGEEAPARRRRLLGRGA